MIIFVTVKDAANENPLSEVEVEFSIDNKKHEPEYSNEEGKIEYKMQNEYIGKNLLYRVKKDGFDSQENTKYIDKEEIHLDIRLVPRKIKYNLGFKNKHEDPLENVKVILEFEGKQVGTGYSGGNGKVSIELSPELMNKDITINASLKGFKQYRSKPIKYGHQYEIPVPPVILISEKIQIKTKIEDEKSTPLEGIRVIFEYEGKQVGSGYSDQKGELYIELGQELMDKRITYTTYHKDHKQISNTVMLDKDKIYLPHIVFKQEEKIIIHTKIKDEKNTPLEGIRVIFEYEGKQVGSGYSDQNGELSIELSQELKNKRIDYTAYVKDYIQINDSILLDGDKIELTPIVLFQEKKIPEPFSLNLLDMNCTLNRNYVSRNGGVVFMGINIKAPDNVIKHIPYRICLVIDSSSSMAGEKIINAKKAAIDLIGKLDSIDYAGIITFDSKVHVIVPGEHVVDKNSFNEKINRIQAEGATGLYKGLVQAFEELKKPTHTVFGKEQEPVKKIILLSDGNPTDGVLISKYKVLATDLRNSGISISTFGLGDDYNEDLLSAIAESSSGIWQHVNSSRDISSIFMSELDSFKSVVYPAPKLTLQKGALVQIDKLYMVIPEISLIDGKNQYSLRDIQAGETQKLVAKIIIQPRPEMESEEILETHIKVATVNIIIPADQIRSHYQIIASSNVIAKYSKDELLLENESDPDPRNLYMTSEATLLSKKALSDKSVLIEAKNRVNTILKDPNATRIKEVKDQVTKVSEMLSKTSVSEEDKKKMKSEMTKTKVISNPETGRARLILPGRIIELDEDEALFGKEDFNDDVPSEKIKYISHKKKPHFRIFKENNRYYIEDTKSLNGTKVNEININPEKGGKGKQVLNDGDRIVIANVLNMEFKTIS